MKIQPVIFLILCIILIGCSEKFDKQRWTEGDGTSFSYRDDMLDDLLTNHKLIGLNYHQLVNLLGDPQGKDSSSIFYDIKIKYDMIDPVYSKDLKIYMNKDSVVSKVEIKEWKKNK